MLRTIGAGSGEPRGGYALLELFVAIVVTTTAVGAISLTLLSTSSLSRSTEERTRALAAALSTLETIRAEDPAEAFARFNSTPDDDPPDGASPGRHFQVLGLRARDGDPDGFTGEILFPGDGVELHEDVADVGLGLPRDLNSDGVIDAADHAADYTLLPVRVRVEWTGSGTQRVELHSMVGRL